MQPLRLLSLRLLLLLFFAITVGGNLLLNVLYTLDVADVLIVI